MIALRDLMWALEQCPDTVKGQVLDGLSAADQRAIEEAWEWQALAGQRVPDGEWRTWLIMAGRGFGKTRTGAEWVLEQARQTPGARIALIGASIDDAARVMVEGESGLIACSRTGERIDWLRSKSELRFASGAVGQLYSGASPQGLRGPQHHFAWADEIAKWLKPVEAWDMLQMGLRLGDRPRAVVTTTPSPHALFRRLSQEQGTVTTGGRTFDNPHLPAAFIAAIHARYGGSRLARQELNGEYLAEADGALWTRDLIEARRCEAPGELERVVIGVDPPASDSGDACGIVVCGALADGRCVVLADCSVSGRRPEGWARAVADAAEAWGADRIVAESNNGGQMIASVIHAVAPGLPVSPVHASRGKGARAEPVAVLFETGRCLFAGSFPELEDELSAMTVAGFAGGGSPDRADAMIWAMTALARRPVAPRIRSL